MTVYCTYNVCSIGKIKIGIWMSWHESCGLYWTSLKSSIGYVLNYPSSVLKLGDILTVECFLGYVLSGVIIGTMYST